MSRAWLFPIILGTLVAGATGQEAQRFAVCAGVNEYRDFNIPGRTEGETYAFLVAERFANPEIGAVPMDRVGALAGGQASLSNLVGALEFCQSAAAEDEVFIYLCLTLVASVGEDGQLELYLCPYNADLADLPNTAITLRQLADYVAAIPATKKLVMLDASPWDAFRAEGTPEDLAVPGDVLEPLAASSLVLSAVSPGQKLNEAGLARPLLGFCLTNCVTGFADTDPPDATVTVKELVGFTKSTAERVYQGSGGEAQTPTLLGGEPSDAMVMKSMPPEPRCPAGMRLVEGRVCIDVFEAPNLPGAKPMADINQFGASGWCRQKDKRLCEPDEWEAGCRGPDGLQFSYGNRPVLGACNIGVMMGEDAHAERLGSRPYCVSGYGLYDMIGNVAEWIGSNWGSEETTVDHRGASFRDQRLDRFDCTTGGPKHPVLNADHVGFRCCADPR
ncbi:MAG: formylglycine-generating enzyme family protein [candidate division WS1 bacterium]|jgi:hypothetical protein|nr:formylglycine-generating enzyme family protein [candidate division WS1 bacterium]